MNKALHAFVYLFLALAGGALWFELQLNAKRTLLTDRNRLQEEYFIKLARTIEKAEASKDVAAPEVKKDVSPVEARLNDSPDQENVLEDYASKAYLETANLETFNWDGKKDQLRMVYVTEDGTPNGKPVMDGTRPLDRGPGTEHELLDSLFEAAKRQQTTLNTTRAELPKLRAIIEDVVGELNSLKQSARQDKVTIVEKDEKIAALEKEKADLQNQVVSIKGQINELNGEITSLRDEVQTAKDDAAVTAESLEAAEKKVAQLTNLLKDAMQNAGAAASSGATAVSNVPFGDKGKVVEADNEAMFAIIELTSEAISQLKGNSPNTPIPPIELSVKRVGWTGEAGEFVGRLRIRQEIAGKNYVICDILSAWRQTDMRAGDVVFAD